MRYTIQDFNKEFPDNDSCLQYLFNRRFSNAVCPSCNKAGNYHRQADSSHYVCSCGKHQISPKKDTIFENSSTDLYKWFFAIFLFSTSKNGVSAKELQRQLGVTYKCAWRIAKQIRSLFSEDTEPFDGTVEVDETYIGGRAKGKRGRGSDKKTPVVGLVEREGSVRAVVTENVKSSTVMPLIKDNVKEGSMIMTDEFVIYQSLTSSGYEHQTVNHGSKQYVEGIKHTNTIEGFWSQLKRSVNGTYHAVSPKYLQTYVDEFAYRYNQRKSESPLFFGLVEKLF
jgi:transposase-like protein